MGHIGLIFVRSTKVGRTSSHIHRLLEADPVNLLLQVVHPVAHLLHVGLLHAFRQVALLAEELLEQIGRLLTLLLHFGLEVRGSCIKQAFHVIKDRLRTSHVQARLQGEEFVHVDLLLVQSVQRRIESFQPVLEAFEQEECSIDLVSVSDMGEHVRLPMQLFETVEEMKLPKVPQQQTG